MLSSRPEEIYVGGEWDYQCSSDSKADNTARSQVAGDPWEPWIRHGGRARGKSLDTRTRNKRERRSSFRGGECVIQAQSLKDDEKTMAADNS